MQLFFLFLALAATFGSEVEQFEQFWQWLSQGIIPLSWGEIHQVVMEEMLFNVFFFFFFFFFSVALASILCTGGTVCAFFFFKIRQVIMEEMLYEVFFSSIFSSGRHYVQ